MSYERDSIRQMTGYTSGEQPQDDATLKLNTNENPYPPSPQVQAKLLDLHVESLRTYPHPTADPLRDVLDTTHAVNRENIVVTHGGDEALRLPGHRRSGRGPAPPARPGRRGGRR